MYVSDAEDTTTGSICEVVAQDVTDKVSSQNVNLQGVNEEVTAGNVIAHGRKRKPSDEDMVINGVSNPKRIHRSHVNHDHTYHISKSTDHIDIPYQKYDHVILLSRP